MIRSIASLIVAITVGASAFATTTAFQSPQRPVRDLRVEPTGTGVISGVVQEFGEAARVLRRAEVQLNSDVLMTSRLFHTRDDGSFTFDGLPAGQYMLSVRRDGYMPAEYGAQRQGGAGSAIVIGNGQRVTDVVLRMSRWATITGVIYDQDGEPAPGVSVEALRYTMRTGRRTLSSVYGQPSTTDDRGVYHLAGLLPGEYYVAAGPSPDRWPLDVQQLTTADIDRALQLLNAPTPAPITDLTYAQAHQAYAPVYFPGSTDFAGAQAVTLVQGEERGGVNIRLQLVRTARLEGSLTSLDGRPVAGTQIFCELIAAASSLDLFSPNAVLPVSTDAQGHFVFPALVPGRYVFSARSAAAQGGLWAMAEVTVGGSDQTVNLTYQLGVTVSGRVVFAGTTLAQPTPTSVRITIANKERTPNAFFFDPLGVAPVSANADGTFMLTGVPPGSYRLSSTPPVAPAGWALRSAVVNGVDALDFPFSVSPGQPIDGVVVTFTDRPTELSGTLQTPAGTPTSDYFIVVFAADRSLWLPSARRNAMARPASTGRYLLRNLPPGDYLVAAITDVETGDWFDPAFLERLVPAATRITLSESEKKTLDLKIAGKPEGGAFAPPHDLRALLVNLDVAAGQRR